MLFLQLLSSSLRHLDISGNALKNLQGVEQLYNLTWLDAGHNALQASNTHNSLSCLPDVVKAADAVSACLSNEVTSSMFFLLQSAAEVSRCSQLQVLGLAHNHLTSLDGLEGKAHQSTFFMGASVTFPDSLFCQCTDMLKPCYCYSKMHVSDCQSV